MRVNGHDFVHISARTGSAELHLALIQSHVRAFDLDRLILRDAGAGIDPNLIAFWMASGQLKGMKTILFVSDDGNTIELSAEIQDD